jgi:hypothetical protein
MISGVLFALLLASPAQTGTIQGTVVREGTSDPVVGVKITVGGGAPMNPRQAQMVLSAQAIGETISSDDIATAHAVIARQASGEPAAPATPITAVTDNDGHFTLQNVPVGSASLRAQLTGYFGPGVNGMYPDTANTSVVVKENESSNVKISMVPAGTISGKVFDSNGKPLFNAIVGVLRPGYTRGASSLEAVDGKTSDDLGGFRIYPLPPGEYYVVAITRLPGARATADPSAEVQVSTLFPNATTVDAAAKITLAAGEEARGIDVHVRTARTFTISGRVSSTFPPIAPRTGRGGVAIPMTAILSIASREPDGFSDIIGGATAGADADGKFQFPNIPPGSYDLYARLPIDKGWGGLAPPERATNASAYGRAIVEVRGNDIDNVQVVVHQGMDVRGRITVDGVPKTAKVFLNLTPDETLDRVGDSQTSSVYGQVTVYRPTIAADGTFAIPVVPEGHYRIAVQIHEPGATYVADIRQGSFSVYDNGLQVGNAEVAPLEVEIKTNAGSVDALVSGADQKIAVGKTVVLVPTQRRQNPVLYVTGQSDANGRVLMPNVAPGQYKLFAWESVRPGSWMNAEFMKKIEEAGTAVTVGAGTRQSAQVRLIPGS